MSECVNLNKLLDYVRGRGDVVSELPASIRKQWDDLGYGIIQAFYQW